MSGARNAAMRRDKKRWMKTDSENQKKVQGAAAKNQQKQMAKGKRKPLRASTEQQSTTENGGVTISKVGNPNVKRSAAGSNWNTATARIQPVELISIASTSGTNTCEQKQSLNGNNDSSMVAPLEKSGRQREMRKSTSLEKDIEVLACGDNNENQKCDEENAIPVITQSRSARQRQRRKLAQRNKYVAMDCEMVGVGFKGCDDMLARVSIVNKCGDVLLDKFVKPMEAVVDYRTSVSGIRPHNIMNGEDFNAVQDEVLNILQGKILVGHGIRKDLSVLHLKHPYANIRDTSRYKPLCHLVANGRTPSLKRLSKTILGIEIQSGEHNSVEDARAAMNIYNRLSTDWELYIQKNGRKSTHHYPPGQQ